MAQPAKVLIVDDEPFNVDYLEQECDALGYATISAGDGQAALKQVVDGKPDVILLDIMLPVINGFEVLERLKADPTTADIPVLIISAMTDMASVVRGIGLGAEDYLPKPFDALLLKTRLRTCLAKKRLRDLEKRYLQQEMVLRQNEKLATIGRLSAGLTHELNNPAAAAQRGAAQLGLMLEQTNSAQLNLLRDPLTPEQHVQLAKLEQTIQARVQAPLRLNGITRSDHVVAIESLLISHGITDMTHTTTLVDLGYTDQTLSALLADFPRPLRATLLAWLCGRFDSHRVLAEIQEGATRISEIVKALKLYIYLDQAPVQQVNVHEGLESTLLILRSKLIAGITVQRDYAPNLPCIEAHGSELNQVWTNLIDNAVAAMRGQGTLTLSTRREGDWVIVEISDDGPGIPAEMQARIFDPFFTTKAPGEGSGLGLSICHNIVVNRHQGKLSVTSQPGNTCFTTALPIILAKDIQMLVEMN